MTAIGQGRWKARRVS